MLYSKRILNNILYLNRRLYHMKLVASPLCSPCKREVETISHLFLRCEFSKRLWAETGGLPGVVAEMEQSYNNTSTAIREDTILRMVFK